MDTSAYAEKRRMRRKDFVRRRIAAVSLTVSSLFLVTVLALFLRVIPVQSEAADGRKQTVHISLMQRMRGWQPLLYSSTPNEDLDPAQVHMQEDPPLQAETFPPETTAVPEQTAVSEQEALIPRPLSGEQLTVLFLGLDETRSNTDVIMLALFDLAGGKAQLLQIPRDSFVPSYTAFEAGKLNSVYTRGDPSLSPPQRTAKCVSDILAVPVDRYAETGCTEIARLVDLIGGVPVDMPYAITFEADKVIPAGRQVLTGEQAEWLVRFRRDYAEGDIGRLQAQRIFLAAATERVRQLSKWELLRLLRTVLSERLVGSDLTAEEMMQLADFAAGLDASAIGVHLLPGEPFDYHPPVWQLYSHYSVWSVHAQSAALLMDAYFRPHTAPVGALPQITELVPQERYLPFYDDESSDFQRISEGDAFSGH